MRVTSLAFASSLLIALTACTYGGNPWRLKQTDKGWVPVETTDKTFDVAAAVAGKKAAPTWEPFPTFDLGIIEFKDDGTLWSPAQKHLVVEKIREIAKTGATIIVYAHGWHHNAKVDDGNIVSFRNVLATIASQQHVGMTCGDRNPTKNHVVGVYIGWRRESSTNKVLTWLTIWDRKRAAHTIGGPSTTMEKRVQELKKRLTRTDTNDQETFPDVLRDLDNIRIAANNEIHVRNQRFTSLTIVGHSLGGAMLLSAMQQIVFGTAKPHDDDTRSSVASMIDRAPARSGNRGASSSKRALPLRWATPVP